MSDKEDHQAVLRNCGTVYKIDLREKENRSGEIHVDIAAVELRRILEVFYNSLPQKQHEKLTAAYNEVTTAIQNRYGKFAVIAIPVLNKEFLIESDDYHLD